MSDEFIDYGQLIDDAMHIIVKKALERVCREGLPGKHHFFISFLTNYPGVSLSKALKDKYPDEMTIVIQHQFEDLTITDKGFSVVLSFDNVKERIAIPFDSLLAFADPSVKFGLQFRHMDEFDEEFGDLDIDEVNEIIKEELAELDLGSEESPKVTSKKPKKNNDNVVDMDSFRKK